MKRWQTPALQNAVGKVKDATYEAAGVTGILWQKHRPTSAVGYLVFLGGGLLGMAAVCSSLNFIAGILLVLSWGGFFLYSFLVVASSVVYAVAGTSTTIFSMACAGAGCFILTGAGGAYLVQKGLDKAVTVSKTYHEAVAQEIAHAQNQHRGRTATSSYSTNGLGLDGTSSKVA